MAIKNNINRFVGFIITIIATNCISSSEIIASNSFEFIRKREISSDSIQLNSKFIQKFEGLYVIDIGVHDRVKQSGEIGKLIVTKVGITFESEIYPVSLIRSVFESVEKASEENPNTICFNCRIVNRNGETISSKSGETVTFCLSKSKIGNKEYLFGGMTTLIEKKITTTTFKTK